MIAALIEINIYLCVLATLYYISRQFLTSSIRRNYLRFMPLAAIGIYFVKFLIQNNNNSLSIPHLQLNIIEIVGGTTNIEEAANSIFTLTNFYWLGLILFLGFSVLKIYKALSYFSNPKYLKGKHVFLSSSEHLQSFTFLNKIHLSKSLDKGDREIVFEHELLHVKYKHSIDLLMMEIWHALFWINPLVFILKKELIAVHEYQVDKDMYLKHSKSYLKYLLASTMGVNSSQILLTSQFYNGLSLTQRKKQMKTKMKNNWAVLIMLPLFTVSLAFVSFTTKTEVILKMVVLEQDTVYDIADVLPEFPGGQTAMIKFIVNTVNYPEKTKADGISGTTYTSFVVQANGEITDITTAKAINPLLDKESIRVIKAMPNWTPGEKDGKKVAVRYTIPLKFALAE